ncbi:hypothetical protein [Brucella tritici]|uniref:hypothetical protein n=1 Tax=Brucella tritici TaxID=94626 RepID=UPI001F3F774D|nr:hypothetical protein [Brucella tritici]
MSDTVNQARTFEVLTAEPVRSRRPPRDWSDDAECFVGCGNKAGSIMCRDAGEPCDLPACKGNFYRGETQRAGNLCRASPGRKGRLMVATKEVDSCGSQLRGP